jgi:hypothetical protein
MIIRKASKAVLLTCWTAAGQRRGAAHDHPDLTPRIGYTGQPLAQAAVRLISGKNPGQLPRRGVNQRKTGARAPAFLRSFQVGTLDPGNRARLSNRAPSQNRHSGTEEPNGLT